MAEFPEPHRGLGPKATKWWHILPVWPTERQWVTIWIIAIFLIMLTMAYRQPALWQLDPFVSIIQAVAITGLLNMVVAFHFSANHNQTQSSQNTNEALKLVRELQQQVAERPKGTEEDPVAVTPAEDKGGNNDKR